MPETMTTTQFVFISVNFIRSILFTARISNCEEDADPAMKRHTTGNGCYIFTVQ